MGNTSNRGQSPAIRLGRVIRSLRESQGVTATALAKEAGISRSYLSYLETGQFNEIGVEKLAAIVRALKVSAEEVLARAGYLEGQGVLPEPEAYLKSKLGLKPGEAREAVRFIEFLLAKRERTK